MIIGTPTAGITTDPADDESKKPALPDEKRASGPAEAQWQIANSCNYHELPTYWHEWFSKMVHILAHIARTVPSTSRFRSWLSQCGVTHFIPDWSLVYHWYRLASVIREAWLNSRSLRGNSHWFFSLTGSLKSHSFQSVFAPKYTLSFGFCFIEKGWSCLRFRSFCFRSRDLLNMVIATKNDGNHK